MKKFSSQISVALVCAFLGFMLTYQFKVMYRRNTSVDVNKQNAEIILENEQLRKQKEEYLNKIDELEGQIIEYEKSAVGRDEQSQMLLRRLEETRLLLGTTDVKGEGVIIYITPSSSILGGSSQPIHDFDLVTIVNELKAAKAEAISINDVRLTSNAGIRNASNTIVINNSERISTYDRVTIKAIGRRDLLDAALSLLPQGLFEIEWKTYDEITIPKSNEFIEFKYAKPVEK